MSTYWGFRTLWGAYFTYVYATAYCFWFSCSSTPHSGPGSWHHTVYMCMEHRLLPRLTNRFETNFLAESLEWYTVLDLPFLPTVYILCKNQERMTDADCFGGACLRERFCFLHVLLSLGSCPLLSERNTYSSCTHVEHVFGGCCFRGV